MFNHQSRKFVDERKSTYGHRRLLSPPGEEPAEGIKGEVGAEQSKISKPYIGVRPAHPISDMIGARLKLLGGRPASSRKRIVADKLVSYSFVRQEKHSSNRTIPKAGRGLSANRSLSALAC